jgi:GNAT superfamily N-acetyltransferase
MMSNDVTCKVVSISDIVNNKEAKQQFIGLVEEQWLEVDHRRKTSKLDVDFDKYIKMDDLGIHFIVLAYTDEELVGYDSMFISPTPHTGEITALTDSMFIKRKYRKGGLGTVMIKMAEGEAKARGAKHMMVTFKNDSPHPEIVKDLGFFSYETIYAKTLGD